MPSDLQKAHPVARYTSEHESALHANRVGHVSRFCVCSLIPASLITKLLQCEAPRRHDPMLEVGDPAIADIQWHSLRQAPLLRKVDGTTYEHPPHFIRLQTWI